MLTLIFDGFLLAVGAGLAYVVLWILVMGFLITRGDR